METTQIRPVYSAPIVVQVRPNQRLKRLSDQLAQHQNEIRGLEKQIQTLSIEAQRLDRSGANNTLDAVRRRSEIRQQLLSLEEMLRGVQHRHDQVSNEREQWVEQFAWNEYRRGLLWQELATARPGCVSDWSYAKLHNYGEREIRTVGDVKRDLVSLLQWLINFGDSEQALAELQQLETEI